jgi:hypothetical protein
MMQAQSVTGSQQYMRNDGRVMSGIDGVRIRSIALPVEHGAWAFLFEPMVLGLVLAPSLAGLFISLGALGTFLTRHPLKLAIVSWRRCQRTSRTILAECFVLLYVTIAALGFVAALKAADRSFLVPFLIAVPILLVQFRSDSVGRSRALVAELAGSISIGALATAIALANGWSRLVAFGLWVIVVARNVPTILYLRARLRILHRKPAAQRSVIVTHMLAVAIVVGLAYAEAAPYLAIVAFVILLLRSFIGFSRSDRFVTAKKLGLRELVFGAMTISLVALGYIVGW